MRGDDAMVKDIIVVYRSIYNGCSGRIAWALASQLNCAMCDARSLKAGALDKYKTVILGSGIYFGCHHPDILALVDSLNPRQTVAIFSAHGNPFGGVHYHSRLRAALGKAQVHVLGEFCCRGYDRTGPFNLMGGAGKGRPNEGDLRRAALWIERLVPAYSQPDLYMQLGDKRKPIVEGYPNEYEVTSGGETHYLLGDRVTVDTTACSTCGKCVTQCPMRVFQIENFHSIPERELDCIQCGLCRTFCPNRAIFTHFTMADSIKVAMRHSKRHGL